MSVYYDYRGTKHLRYNQAGLGLETLGELVDARINGYLPFFKKISSSYDTKFGYFSGHSMILSQKVEFAMKGIDAEMGFHTKDSHLWNFYAAAGPYYFRGPGGPNVWGGKVRASLTYRDWITLEIIESYDNVFHNKTQGQIALSIPFGRRKLETKTKSLDRRRIQPVIRNEIIVLDHKHKYSAAKNPFTGLPYYFVFVNNTSSSEGTFESPYPSLELAEQNSAPGQIIYVFPGDGTTAKMNHGITLKPSQKIWGSGVLHNLLTSQGPITIPQMSSTTPQITNSDLLQPGVTLSTNNDIRGITFTQTSGHAILGSDPITLNISNCTFSNCGIGDLGIFPVFLQASSPLTVKIENNIFIDNPNAGVYVKLLSGASLTEIAMNYNQGYSNHSNSNFGSLMTIEPYEEVGACKLVMTHNILKNNDCAGANIGNFDTPRNGSFTSFEGTFTRNTFTENASSPSAITFKTNAEFCALSIQDNDLSNNTAGSIAIFSQDEGTQLINNSTIVIDSNQMNNGVLDAITISPAGDTISITITNNSISNNQGTGFVSYFDLPGPSATLVIANNVIQNNQNNQSNASGGISFDMFKSATALIENNIFSQNAQGNSIGKNGGSSPDTSTVTFINNQLSDGDTFEFDFWGNSPETGCLTIFGNTAATDPTYTFLKQASGSCFIVPCNYATQNTGGFTLSDDVQTSSDCSGTSCPSR